MGEGKEPWADEQLLQAMATLASLPEWPCLDSAGQSSWMPFKHLDVNSVMLWFPPAFTPTGLLAPALSLAGQKTVPNKLVTKSTWLSLPSSTERLRELLWKRKRDCFLLLPHKLPQGGQGAGSTQ